MWSNVLSQMHTSLWTLLGHRRPPEYSKKYDANCENFPSPKAHKQMKYISIKLPQYCVFTWSIYLPKLLGFIKISKFFKALNKIEAYTSDRLTGLLACVPTFLSQNALKVIKQFFQDHNKHVRVSVTNQ